MVTLTRTTKILIHAPLQSVFDYVSDITKHPEWSGGELKIEAVTPGPITVGKEYRSKGQVATQKDRPNTVRISEYEPPHKFGFVANDPDFGDVAHVFTFSQQNGSVLVTRTMALSLNPFLAFLFKYITYPIIGNPSMKRSFEKLKKNLEE